VIIKMERIFTWNTQQIGSCGSIYIISYLGSFACLLGNEDKRGVALSGTWNSC
jgi:hypothetical protein